MEHTIIIEDKCTECGICVEVCAASVIEEIDGRPQVIRSEVCLHCGHCSAVCPSEAIEQTNKDMKEYDRDLLPHTGSLQHLFRSRRSVRHYKDKSISDKDLNKILEAGRYTATGSNSQNVHYIVYTDKEKIVQLQEKMAPALFKLFRLSQIVTSMPLAQPTSGRDYETQVKGI